MRRAGAAIACGILASALLRSESRKLLPLPVFKLLDLRAANQGQAGQRQKTEHEHRRHPPISIRVQMLDISLPAHNIR